MHQVHQKVGLYEVVKFEGAEVYLVTVAYGH